MYGRSYVNMTIARNRILEFRHCITFFKNGFSLAGLIVKEYRTKSPDCTGVTYVLNQTYIDIKKSSLQEVFYMITEICLIFSLRFCRPPSKISDSLRILISTILFQIRCNNQLPGSKAATAVTAVSQNFCVQEISLAEASSQQ